MGDCLELMPHIPDASVDMVLADLPYGTTACAWDTVIPFDALWSHYWRIAKPNAPIVLTASQPFTTSLIGSQMDHFKYEWIWEKTMASGFALAKNRPLKAHENVLIFSRGTTVHASQSVNRMNYFPQMEDGKPYVKKKVKQDTKTSMGLRPSTPDVLLQVNNGSRYPRSVIDVPNPNNANIHPTQKPVALFEYLIKTYTNPGDLVLDNCSGSGTTAIAAQTSGRRWLCIEKDPIYYLASCGRVHAAVNAASVAA